MPSSSTFNSLSKRIIHQSNSCIKSSPIFPNSIHSEKSLVSASPICVARQFHSLSPLYFSSDASNQTSQNTSSQKKSQDINNEASEETESTSHVPEAEKTPEQKQREEILAQLRTKKLMAPLSQEEALLQRRRLSFENRHFGVNQQGDQDNSAQDAEAQESAPEGDPYAFVQKLTPAKYLSTKTGRHVWKAYYLYQDEADPTSTELLEVEINMRDATLIKSKYATEDLNLAMHLLLDAQPAPPTGAHIPFEKEREIKMAIHKQIFVEPEPTFFEKVIRVFKHKAQRQIVAKVLFISFCILWMAVTIIQATVKAVQRRRKYKKDKAELQAKQAIKHAEDIERARQRRLAAGLPMYDEEEQV